MWKGPTLTIDRAYPFGALQQESAPRHLVRQKIPKNDRQLEKARVQAHLKHDCLIKLESAQEEEGEYFLLFEYVPVALEQWSQSVSREFIENYEQRLILFSRYLADRAIVTTFHRDSMGVNASGEAKYFLDPLFEVEPAVDKLALKKKYKEQIRELIQGYIDKKVQGKGQPQGKGTLVPDKKENPKLQKILEAIEKGKANLCPEKGKETSLVPQQNGVEAKSTLKPIKNIQNVFIQKEMNKVNKIQVMVNNRPVELLQQEYKREYASSSLYVNGMPTVVMEREGECKRLVSPNDKFARFQQVKFKEYKSLKKSGEVYVQDFINVLEADDTERMGSPRAALRGGPKLGLAATSRNEKDRLAQSPQLSIEPQQQKEPQKRLRPKQSMEDGPRKGEKPRENLFLSQNGLRVGEEGQKGGPGQGGPGQGGVGQGVGQGGGVQGGNKTTQLQKKVSDAIANSLNAISKFKSGKNVPG